METDNNKLIQGRNAEFNPIKGDLVATAGGDIQLSKYYDNLAQSIHSRLATRQNELPMSPNYGSRLYELIGEKNNDDNRHKVKLFVLEALGQEPRIETVNSISVYIPDGDTSSIRVEVYITPIQYAQYNGQPEGDPIEMNLTYDFFITEGGLTVVSADTPGV